MNVKILYPTILPIAGGIIGFAMGLSYYLGIMISQLFIGRPPSTWIIGVLWLPVLIFKPSMIGFLIGSGAWLVIRPFHRPRTLLPTESRLLKIVMALLMTVSAAAGIIKLIKEVGH